MEINGLSGKTQGSGYNMNAANMDDAKVQQYDQMLMRLKQNLKRTEKDAKLSEEEKQQKRQELQIQIAELDRQKRAAEMEARQQKMPGTGEIAARKYDGIAQQPEQEEDGQEDTFKLSTKPVDVQKEHDEKEEPKERLLTANQMETVIIGGSTMKQTKGQQNTAQALENRIRILGGEINMDQSRNVDTSAKEAELEDLEEREANARESIAKRLGNGRRKVEEQQEQAQREIQQQKFENIRFIQSQKDVALPNFQISI